MSSTRPHSAAATPTRAEWLELRRLRRYAGGRHALRKDKPRSRIKALREMENLRAVIAARTQHRI